LLGATEPVVVEGVGVEPVEGAVTVIEGTLVAVAAAAAAAAALASFSAFSAFSDLSFSFSFSLSFSFSASFFLFASLTFIIALASNSCFSHFEKIFVGGAGLLPDPTLTLVLSDSPGDSGVETPPLDENVLLKEELPVRLNAREADDILLTAVIVKVEALLPLFPGKAMGNPTVVAIECLYEGCPALLGMGSSWPESEGEYEAGEIVGVVEADADQRRFFPGILGGNGTPCCCINRQ